MNIYSDELSHKYSELRENYTATDEKTFSILNNIGVRDKRILDFGCGDGRYSFQIAKLGASEVIGIDISPVMIEIASRELQNHKIEKVKFLEANGNNLPFEDNSFDIVFSNFVLHHFENTLKPLQEISRALKKGGNFLATFNTYTLAVGKESLFNTEIPMRLGKNENSVLVHVFVKPEQELHKNLEVVGLKEVSYEKVDNPDAVIDPSYPQIKSVEKFTIICLAEKI